MSLVRAFGEEPYRLLFPIGILHLVFGIGVWIIFGLHGGDSPMAVHLAVSTQGFLQCFVIGFLATMAPNLLDAPRAGWPFVGAVLAAILLAVIGQITTRDLLVDLGRAGAWILLAALGIRCLCKGQRLPPPPRMATVAVALLGGIAASLLAAVAGFGIEAPSWWRGWSYTMHTQAILLLLSLGISGLLLPRLAAGTGADPRAMAAANPTLRAYITHALLALMFLATYLGEAMLASGSGFGTERSLAGTRVVVALILAWPALRAGWSYRLPLFLRGAQLSLLSMVAGLTLAAVQPERAITWNHLIFIGGFLLLTMMIGARVCTAHAGRAELVERGQIWVGSMIVLVFVALGLRLAADFLVPVRAGLLAAAAIAGLLALGVWSWRCLALILVTPPRP